MFLTEYNLSHIPEYQQLIEQLTGEHSNIQQDMVDPNQANVTDPMQANPELNKALEFENIKKYILYQKIKEIRQSLEHIDNNEKYELIEFIDFITLFFNTFLYEEIVSLTNDLIAHISSKFKLKLPIENTI